MGIAWCLYRETMMLGGGGILPLEPDTTTVFNRLSVARLFPEVVRISMPYPTKGHARTDTSGLTQRIDS